LNDHRVESLDALLIDIGLPHMNGIDLLKLIHSRYPKLKIIIITAFNADDMIFNALKFGASGYIWKNEIKNIKDSVLAILEGGSYMSPSIGIHISQYFRSQVKENSDSSLSTREKQILELIITGRSVTQISKLLSVSEGTIRKHINNIYSKLEVSNRVQLMQKARGMGYV